jgi:two-component system response regulator HupR/HoxA
MVDKRPTILLVDDEALSLDTMARILDEEFDVEKATSAAAAEEILQSEAVELIEASILRETLVRNRWNKSRAAEELGLSRVGLRSKLERYGLEPKLNS